VPAAVDEGILLVGCRGAEGRGGDVRIDGQQDGGREGDGRTTSQNGGGETTSGQPLGADAFTLMSRY
jgi:hypothetical protein